MWPPYVVSSLALGFVLWYGSSLYKSYQIAKSTGLPVLLFPFDTENIVWRIFSRSLRSSFQRILPTWLSFRLEMGTYGFEVNLREEIEKRYGSSWVIAGPGCVQLWTLDEKMMTGMLQRSKHFAVSHDTSRILGICGPNIASSEGASWQRQRRIVAPMFSERTSTLAWQESVAQAETMVQHYTTLEQGVNNDSIRGLQRIAINVLGAVGYGRRQSWHESIDSTPSDGQRFHHTFTSALFCIVSEFVIAVFLPVRLLLLPQMPKKIQAVGHARQEFAHHAETLIMEEQERAATADHVESAVNIMSKMVQLMQQDSNPDSKLYLTKDEIVGNLFQITLAGYDTTANTMAYALVLMAVYPEWQAWIIEEIDQVYASTMQNYSETFPQLTRCLALMYETLRLYTPVAHLQRDTRQPVMLESSAGTQHEIPAGLCCNIGMALAHLSPGRWGADAATFRPSRWISEQGTFVQPSNTTFMPWSAGPRTCPGMKMAQVEFVAVMSTILKQCRVTPAVISAGNVESARQSLIAMLAESQPLITLQMSKPENVYLQWTLR